MIISKEVRVVDPAFPQNVTFHMELYSYKVTLNLSNSH